MRQQGCGQAWSQKQFLEGVEGGSIERAFVPGLARSCSDLGPSSPVLEVAYDIWTYIIANNLELPKEIIVIDKKFDSNVNCFGFT